MNISDAVSKDRREDGFLEAFSSFPQCPQAGMPFVAVRGLSACVSVAQLPG